MLQSPALAGGPHILSIDYQDHSNHSDGYPAWASRFRSLGLYTSIISIAQPLAGMSVSGSGVRQVGAALNTGGERRIAEAVFVLRRVFLRIELLRDKTGRTKMLRLVARSHK
jgi:antigen flippase